MYAGSDNTRVRATLRTLQAKKAAGEKIVALTAYDASFAVALDAAGVDLALVGDSLGNVVQGRPTTLPVTMDEMIYHAAAVARGLTRAMLAVDMPFGTYPDPDTTFRNAVRLMQGSDAAVVKLEGAGPMLESMRFLTERDIPVCAHLGLMPQSVHALGGYRVQGREAADAERLKSEARAAQDAGACLLVLEMVPAALAGEISRGLEIPTIGIGAGPQCDGQILVCYDMLGITPGKRPRFAHDFLAGRGSVVEAMRAYADAVRSGAYPTPEQSY